MDRSGFAVEVDGLVDQKRIDFDFNLLPIVDFIVLEAVVGIGPEWRGEYLSRMKTDLAAA